MFLTMKEEKKLKIEKKNGCGGEQKTSPKEIAEERM